MLNDARLSGRDGRWATERRRGSRAEANCDVVIQWHHDPGTPVRYAVLNLSEGGMRIMSELPLIKGMSGTAVKLVPAGEELHKMCTVSWVKSAGAGKGPFEVGLKFD